MSEKWVGEETLSLHLKDEYVFLVCDNLFGSVYLPHAARTFKRRRVDPCDIPGRGKLQGRITLLMAVQETVRITVNAGVLVTLLISGADYLRRRPCLGDAVRLRLQQDGISWVE